MHMERSRIHPRANSHALESALCDLLEADSRGLSGTREAAILQETVEQTVAAGFDHDVDSSLDDAHQTLYRIYGAMVWGNQRLTAPASRAVESTRMTLEQGFRAQLARDRGMNREDIPQLDDSDIAPWFLDTLDKLPEVEGWGPFIRESATLDDLKQIVADRSLFFLREPDPWIYAVPTLTGIAKAGLIDLLLDEYGWGKHERMHSTIYAGVMQKLGLNTELDHYLDDAPWQYIATMNLQWMHALSPGNRHRLVGIIYLTEAQSPDAMQNYLAAWKRVGIEDEAVTMFYDLHVSADEDHRRVALEEIVVPICLDDSAAIFEIAAGMLDANALENNYLATFAGAVAKLSRTTGSLNAPDAGY